MVTLKDIAREAGVSLTTVSNVINGNLTRVSKENAERIREIVQRRGYIPNASARSLAKDKTSIIAIILRGGDGENALENPHNAELVGTIISNIQQHGYFTMVNMMKCREEIIQTLRSWNVDGAVFLGMFDDEIEDMCSVSNIPMVFVDSYSNVRQLSNVGIDDYKGGQLAARYLVSCGHRDISFVSPPVHRAGVVQHRFAGFCDELKNSGIVLRPENCFVLESDVEPTDIIELGQIIANKASEFTAIFVASDQIASYLIQGLRSKGARIPDDFSIIGFDNLKLCQQITPPLTTIAQDLEAKARLSVDILFRRINTPGSPAESLVLDVELIKRESVQIRR